MKTCFIFFDTDNYLSEHDSDAELKQTLWAIRLDETGQVDSALSAHTIESIQSMQAGARTVIVLPASVASIHCLSLPKLSLRKAREAMPYALEEDLADTVQEVHIAFERDDADIQQYRAIVLNKRRFRACLNCLSRLEIAYDAVTLDWFALKPGELCIAEQYGLVRETDAAHVVNGALSFAFALKFLDTHSSAVFLFDDSKSLPELDNVSNLSNSEGSYRLFIAMRLFNQPFLNLCQGEFQSPSQGKTRLFLYRLCGGLLVAWVLSVLGGNAFLLYRLHREQADIDKQIQSLYYTFFPDATQVLSPRFRIEQFLKQNKEQAQSSFWVLFNRFSAVFLKHPLQLEQIQFRDQAMSVKLVAARFLELEAFLKALRKEAISVKQSEVLMRDNHVVATLELAL